MNLQKIFFIQIQKTSPLKNNKGYSSKSKKILLHIFFLYVLNYLIMRAIKIKKNISQNYDVKDACYKKRKMKLFNLLKFIINVKIRIYLLIYQISFLVPI